MRSMENVYRYCTAEGWRWGRFNKVWLEQGVHEQGVVRNVLAEQVLLLIGRTSDP